jgi:sarcosine oxidase delta subunit
MHTLVCPNCGRRPLDEFTFGGERRTEPSTIEDADERDFDEIWIFDNPAGTGRWTSGSTTGSASASGPSRSCRSSSERPARTGRSS